MTPSPGRRYWALLGLLLPLLAGCGPGQGKVSGRVLLNGAPLPGGLVTFRPADARQNAVTATIDAQGNYEALLPAGEVKVCVDNRELEPPPVLAGLQPPGLPPEVQKAIGGGKADKAAPRSADKPAEKAAGRYVPIPEKYYAVETSGLQFVVQRGDQKQDIQLTR
jgi:hypothetical protein